MTALAEVKLWGRTIGAVSLEEGQRAVRFQYDTEFSESGIEVSPLTMPLSKNIYSFPELSFSSFHGLPGLLADSLPDRFGNAIIDVWLARQGRSSDSFNAVERLCYTGQRGMGALEFYPSLGPAADRSRIIETEALVELASEILAYRNSLNTVLADEEKEDALRDILQVGTSAGGARAKAVIAWNEETGEVKSGQVRAGSGFEYWLLKFDGVSGNRDREMEDPKDFGAIEYAYYKMALKAGIIMSRSQLLEKKGRRHFMSRRFDRTESGEKLHMQSLGGLAHFDYNASGVYSYEQAFAVIRRLGLPVQSVEEQFRRMVFNIIARNQDDHVKNIAFLMDKSGTWYLSPAFDVTYSYNPSGEWTSSHQMSMNGKRENFIMDDFKECEKNILMKRGRGKRIVREVIDAVRQWPDIAGEIGIREETIRAIEKSFRIDLP